MKNQERDYTLEAIDGFLEMLNEARARKLLKKKKKKEEDTSNKKEDKVEDTDKEE